jgi:tetratricopeptide (TPR) repeat protein
MTMRFEDAARELEAQLDEYPDERVDILLEASGQWRRAGDPERAAELLAEVVAVGGVDGAYGRVDLADLYYEQGRDADAVAELDAVRAARLSDPAPLMLAAELLEERGELENALLWFNMAYARADPSADSFEARSILSGRRRVRRALGMPADDLDDAVPEVDEDVLAVDPLSGRRWVAFWPRPELERARQEWPGMDMPDHLDVERDNRRRADEDGTGIDMVPLTVDGVVALATRRRLDYAAATTAYRLEAAMAGKRIEWPPPRNAPCWCGSTAKYKKCCGRPL